jgi:hypothetical protein
MEVGRPGYYFGGRVDGQTLGYGMALLGVFGLFGGIIALSRLPNYHAEGGGWKVITATVGTGLGVALFFGGCAIRNRSYNAQQRESEPMMTPRSRDDDGKSSRDWRSESSSAF